MLPARTGTKDRAVLHPRLILTMTILASSLAFIDGSIVNVGLPAIGRSLAASGESITWIVNGYLLPLSALLLLGGALGDLYGRRRVLVVGVALFAAASILCAAAGNIGWLLAGRVLQGIGAALLMPNSLAILGSTFEGESRGRAIGIWAAVGAAAGAIGPLLGGWLIDLVGWQAMFSVNIPIAAAAIYLAARFVPDERDVDCRGLDLPGAALATAALTMLTWTLTIASSPQPLGSTDWIIFCAGLLSLTTFVAVERRCGSNAMLPLALFSSPSFVGLTVLTFLLYGALGGLLVLIPYVLIELHHYSATSAGAALLPLPLVLALTSPTLGRLAAKIGPRLPLAIGPLIVAGGCLLALGIANDGSYWWTTFPALLVVAIGMAGAVAPLTTAVLSSVDPSHVGVASGFNSAVARTGGLVATAMLSAVFAAQGAAQAERFRVAAMIGAAAAVAAGLSAFFGLKR
jgi:EmrB/QacA subfamily drug resistance transporter